MWEYCFDEKMVSFQYLWLLIHQINTYFLHLITNNDISFIIGIIKSIHNVTSQQTNKIEKI